MKTIAIRNATLHNLKHISVEIPRQKIVAITGVSGSGKSTLAFDLVYEQGRRRYLRSIGMLADLAEETGCERITGLGPTVAVQQGIIRQSNPRSSVGTRSEIFNLLRMLYVYEGRRACPGCRREKRSSETCLDCGQPADGLQAGFFSYNSPLGMCLHCQGRGTVFELNMQKLLPTPETSMRQMLIHTGSASTFHYLMRGLFKEYADLPFDQVPAERQRHILYGMPLGDGRVSHNLFDHLRWKLLKGREVNDCIRHSTCPECQGDRVSPEARQVTLLGQHIGQVSRLSLAELRSFMNCLLAQAGTPPPLTRNLIQEILQKIENLRQNGLAHLTLYRSLPSLSGGELQRLFLASHIDSQLDSLIYVLDEPTVGLHELEKQRLLEQLRLLRDQGNTILLVEHDPHMILAADAVVDLGPLAGAAGGEIIYQGSPLGLLVAPGSVTGRYLSGQELIPCRKMRAFTPHSPELRLLNVSTNNLRCIQVNIPLGGLVGVAGVSGSGKSSLVMKTLVPLLERHFARPDQAAEDGEEEQTVFFSGRLEGAEHLRDFYAVSQQPIGRHDNSNPATYLKIWDVVRKLFACSPEAQALGLSAGHFSFNAGGACPTCSGSGKQRMWLGGGFFTSQVCPACQGRRFQSGVLEVRLRGKNIRDVLEMTAAQGREFFADSPAIQRVLEVLVRSGMGYLPLGQPAPTLSGGEAQRIKLAYEISRSHKGRVLYILDEPTIGLSLYDTSRLLQLLEELIQKGNSVLVVEHDPVILARCDWLIELGPGGGNEGGQVIASGTPADLRANPDSLIGAFLA